MSEYVMKYSGVKYSGLTPSTSTETMMVDGLEGYPRSLNAVASKVLEAPGWSVVDSEDPGGAQNRSCVNVIEWFDFDPLRTVVDLCSDILLGQHHQQTKQMLMLTVMKPLIAADILELKTAQLPDPIKTRFVPGWTRFLSKIHQNQIIQGNFFFNIHFLLIFPAKALEFQTFILSKKVSQMGHAFFFSDQSNELH